MGTIRLSLLAIATCAAIGTTAAPALAAESLPSILWLTTGTMKTLGEAGTPGGGGTTIVLQFNGPLTLTATYMLVQLFGESTIGMADEGKGTILLEGVDVKGTTTHCFTEGDSESKGTILIDNATWRVVLDLSGNTYLLLHIPEFTVKCPGSFPSSIKVRGDVLNKVTPFGGGEHVSLATEMRCATNGSSTAKWKEYDTHEGTMASVKLEANGGLGFGEVCEEIFNPMTNNLSTPAELMEP